MDNYTKEVLKTVNNDRKSIRDRLGDPRSLDILHAAIGISTESAEILDIVKKYAINGKAMDDDKIIDELGDMYWYMHLLISRLGVFESVIKGRNIKKLRERFGDSFSSESAINPNKEREWKAQKEA